MFLAQYDLVRIDDPRVWWESDNDHKDTEDDHLFHRAMEEPFRRLVELVHQAGGTLEVHDAYRPEGIHAPLSLHREGRAVDVTCDQLGLEKLAKLAWAAGFDWVYHEVPRRGGAHVHASVREDRIRQITARGPYVH
jgi:D-alanyl-D-alanine dipeptidase